MNKIQLSDIHSDVKLADLKLSTLSLSANAIVSKFNDIIDSDNSKLPLGGGTISGNLAVGNLNFAIGENALAIGDGGNYAGMTGFKVLSADMDKCILSIQTELCAENALSDVAEGEDVMVYYRNLEANPNGQESMFQSRYCGTVPGEGNLISVTLVPGVKPNNQSYVLFPEHPLIGDLVLGPGAFAAGYNNVAMEDGSAIGCNNRSRGRYGHSIGTSNSAGYYGIAIGTGNSAYGTHSIAMGGSSQGSQPSGDKGLNTAAVVMSDRAFAWSGSNRGSRKNPKPYIVEGDDRDGTFNVDPSGGLDGVYIGDSPLRQLIVDVDSDQDVSGHKTFAGGIEIGEENENIGNNCLAVGNNLTCGSYNFFFKGVDVNSDKTGVFWLCKSQPRYPYPFVCYDSDHTKFKICGKVVNVEDTSTYSCLSSTGSYLPKIWKCALTDRWRDDYNQLSIDLGPDYWENYDPAKVQERLRAYLADAFAADDDVKPYLSGENLVGQQITFVNGDKLHGLRSATVLSVIEGGGALKVKFSDTALRLDSSRGLSSYGAAGFSDFDYDDSSLVLIDSPTLSGPANTSTYSSLNVGTSNTVVRRCSMAVGKQNNSEADFAIAMGRRANAQGYASFVWAPASKTYSAGNYTFTIGLNANQLSTAYLPSFDKDIYVAANNSTHDAAHEQRLYKYVWGCISSDNTMKEEFKKWLGLS